MSAVLAEGQDRRSTAEVLPVALAAMGVVFGDIGTSPLYDEGGLQRASWARSDPTASAGVLSLVFWALTIVVSLKRGLHHPGRQPGEEGSWR
jgi:KUP system potassium uptake protein